MIETNNFSTRIAMLQLLLRWPVADCRGNNFLGKWLRQTIHNINAPITANNSSTVHHRQWEHVSVNISCEHYNTIIRQFIIQRNTKNFNSLSIWNGMRPISLRYYLFLEGLLLDLYHETDQNFWVMGFWCHRVQKNVEFSLSLSRRLYFLPGTRLLATENFMSHESLSSSSTQAMPISIYQVLKLSLNSVIVQTCTGI